MQKALYGILKSVLLFHQKLVGVVTLRVFGLNWILTYPYVVNKIVNDIQMAIICHVDDLKISQKNSNTVT